MKKPFCRYVTAIDIGTTKICVLIASFDASGKMEIVGMGQHPSYGLKKGVVVDIAKTVESIKVAVELAQSMAGIEIEAVSVGISGAHIRSFNSTGVVAVKGREVAQSDIDRVIDAARAVPLPEGQDILHVIPQSFKVDGQERVVNSLGMYGVRLEAEVHIVTGGIASARNIIKSCELAGIKVCDIVLEQLASAHAVLTLSEQEMGVGLLDIGGGTADFAVYHGGCIRHSKVIPIAGNHFTNDIAVSCGIPTDQAEVLKRSYASVLGAQSGGATLDSIDVDLGYQGGVKSVDLAMLCEVVRCRADELCDFVIDELLAFRLQHLMPAGLVLTGGGAELEGMKQLFAARLGMPVRIGVPEAGQRECVKEIPDILKYPKYATGYGLLLYALNEQYKGALSIADQMIVPRLVKKMKSWIYNFF